MTILSDLDTPVFAAEGVPEDVDPGQWRVRIDGLIEKPAGVSLSELKALPNASINCRLTSVSGWSVRADWDGVLWSEFIKAWPPRGEATHVTFTSKGGYETTVPLAALDHPRVLWAWGVGGEALEADYGGPLRMVIPVLWGYKSCKWVVKVLYTDRLRPGYWESRGYTNHGTIEPGVTRDVNSRTRREIRGGEVIEF